MTAKPRNGLDLGLPFSQIHDGFLATASLCNRSFFFGRCHLVGSAFRESAILVVSYGGSGDWCGMATSGARTAIEMHLMSTFISRAQLLGKPLIPIEAALFLPSRVRIRLLVVP